MGNCWCRWEPSVYRVSSNAKSGWFSRKFCFLTGSIDFLKLGCVIHDSRDGFLFFLFLSLKLVVIRVQL
jgi:hypothetical protein